ncbi:glycosyltransferase family 4 protein [Galbibacter sp. EGI 63066]|uniref:glycosyltransferase family 4 protein n=1 Tax=Galbibacter sp. EGI 63066 TaxID=2993559 RepID=UPI00224909B1|nr:glycosyltransferase family 4 protein [Galbibacter sp. EGI 63066]MCX2679167.1 glycosyltransferase family 4 protein [Galbibacter sp. EGI 63066]
MIKILYITNQICGPGGLERVLSVKTSHLIDNFGYEVHILTLNQGAKEHFYHFHPKIIYHDIRVKGNPLQYLLSYINGVRHSIKTIKPDIISVCDDGLKGFFVPLFTNKPCPMVYERHVSKLIEKKNHHNSNGSRLKAKMKYSLMDFGAKHFSKFVVLTKGNKKEWRLNNLHVISNPLPFYPTPSSTLDSKKIITVGKLSPQKGYDILIKSWAKIAHQYPDWKIEIYGQGDDYSMLTELVKKHRLERSFKINKPTQKIEEVYLNASLYVMPSRFEGFGMVLIEAMACGVPCVAFDCPHGPADIIANGEDGILVPNGNIDMLSDKISLLIENDKLRKGMGAKAKQNVRRYQPEQIVKQWDNLFKTLLNK